MRAASVNVSDRLAAKSETGDPPVDIDAKLRRVAGEIIDVWRIAERHSLAAAYLEHAFAA